MKEFWTALASLMGVLAFCQTLFSTLFPPELRFTLLKTITRVSNYFSSYCYFDITEIDGVNTNELYNAVQLYLSSSAAGVESGSRRMSLTRALNSSAITFGLASNDVLTDTFKGVRVQWEHIVMQRNSQSFSWRPLPEEKRGFTLRVKKTHKGIVLNSYLDHIMDRSNEIRRRNEDRYLYTNSRGGTLDSRGPQPWEAVPFKHPSTFDTLAMDPAKKSEIMADLREFASGQSFYQKTGRAWKRGYLLYGPPGTGKSSMIAAMANHLGYDIYDLELTEVNSNSELRKLLMKTTSKSIIVIEDIDCSINLYDRNTTGHSNSSSSSSSSNSSSSINNNYIKRNRTTTPPNPNPKPNGGGAGAGAGRGFDDGSNANNGGSGGNSITLSGLLNFTDGLWSCCGSERIFVFTTNHIDRLDPALLRSGRMDMHIHMGYCGIEALNILISNYLGSIEKDPEVLPSHHPPLLPILHDLVDKAEMTPADVSEILLRNRRDSGRAMKELLEEMKRRVIVIDQQRKKKKTKKNNNNTLPLGGQNLEEEEEEEEEEEQEKRAVEDDDDGASAEQKEEPACACDFDPHSEAEKPKQPQQNGPTLSSTLLLQN